MRARLLILGCFAHDPQGVLTAVCQLALVGVELLLNAGFNRRSERGYGAKLHVAELADAEQGRFSHDPKFSFCHAPSLRRPSWHSIPVEIKWHHYQEIRVLDATFQLCNPQAGQAALRMSNDKP